MPRKIPSKKTSSLPESDKIISSVCENSGTVECSDRIDFKNLQEVLNGKKEFLQSNIRVIHRRRTLVSSASQCAERRGGGAVISHINITDRKKAETELKNSEQFNRSIFENSPDCVKVLELDGTLHSMNANGLCLMEIDDLTYLSADNGLISGKATKMNWLIKPSNRRETENQRISKVFAKRQKEHRNWDVSVAPVFDADGKPMRLISTSRDITERRSGEQERERLLKNEKAARKDAEIANRMRDEFLATVSHELRAPLNSILGWGRLMEKGKLDEATTEKAVTTIVRNAESQNRLIEDLLDVSRIISGKLRLEVMTIKPINVVESALETVRPAAEAKGITLEIKEDVDVSHISGDPNRLQQVIWNLLSNAIKFTPSDGTVTVGNRARRIILSKLKSKIRESASNRRISAARFRPFSASRCFEHPEIRRSRIRSGNRAPHYRNARRQRFTSTAKARIKARRLSSDCPCHCLPK